MYSRNAAIITIIIFFLGLVISFRNYKDENSYENDYKYLTGNILKIIKKNGVKKSVDVVEHSYNLGLIDINQCHSLLHTVGHAAYEFNSSDKDSIILSKNHICFYGFQHGVEGQIVLSKSWSEELFIQELHNFCKEIKEIYPNIECYHGAGHAFVQQGIPILNILKLCDKISGTTESPEDCYRGAFSEYVNRLRGIDGDTDAPIIGVIPKNIPNEKVFDECLQLPSKYQKSCIAQFSSFLEKNDDLETALNDCNYFKGWVANICAFKITGSYMSVNIGKMSGNEVPKNYQTLSQQVRFGYIDGVVNQYQQLNVTNARETVRKWCLSIEQNLDSKYCLSIIW